jgi:hypothetical protein
MIEHGGTKLKIHDLSVGGCCLVDPLGVMGATVGHEILLNVHWPDGRETIRARLVAGVEQKRHIQFLNMPQNRIEELRALIEPATRGTFVRNHTGDKEHGPSLEAREIWSSLHGDHVIIEDSVHRLGQSGLFAQEYNLYRNAWPVRGDAVPLTKSEVVALILFLSNINQPSALLTQFSLHLQQLALKGAK